MPSTASRPSASMKPGSSSPARSCSSRPSSSAWWLATRSKSPPGQRRPGGGEVQRLLRAKVFTPRCTWTSPSSAGTRTRSRPRRRRGVPPSTGIRRSRSPGRSRARCRPVARPPRAASSAPPVAYACVDPASPPPATARRTSRAGSRSRPRVPVAEVDAEQLDGSVCPSASSPSTRVQTTPSAKSYASAGCTFIRPMVVGRTPDPGTTSASTSTSGSSRNPCRTIRRTAS